MATKNDFSEDQWQRLQWAVSDTMSYISLADPGFWDSFGEANAAAKYIAKARTSSESLLVRDLAGDVKGGRDKEATSSPTDLAGKVTARISEASGIVAEVAPEEHEAFKAFILGLADVTAEAKGSTADNEAEAIDRVRIALG